MKIKQNKKQKTNKKQKNKNKNKHAQHQIHIRKLNYKEILNTLGELIFASRFSKYFF